jgi:hypothetical protein
MLPVPLHVRRSCISTLFNSLAPFELTMIATPAALSTWTVSERDSPALSPACFVGSPVSIAMSRLSSLGASPSGHSPTLSMSSVFLSSSSTFTGQSPALSYRSVSVPAIQQYPSQQHILGNYSHEYRYKSADEDQLRHKLSISEIQLGEHTRTH